MCELTTIANRSNVHPCPKFAVSIRQVKGQTGVIYGLTFAGTICVTIWKAGFNTHFSGLGCVCYRTPTVRIRTLFLNFYWLKPAASNACSIGITVEKHLPGGVDQLVVPACKNRLKVISINKYKTVADLLTDESFIAWQLQQHPGATRVWTRWMTEKPENEALAEEAIQLLAALVTIRQKKLSDYQINTSFERLLRKIKTGEKRVHFIL